MKTTNVLIIGSGPAGLFAAIWLERLGVENITLVDRLLFPAGGLLNDGKLNFDYRIGIDLDELKIDREKANHLIKEVKAVFTGFPHCRQVTFVDKNEKIEVLK
ncbi:MAG: FAD-dependent monooxygenase, partial [Thermodesulfobacteriota bacterium]|nr:FAD-dependent monooxygenase [Thermodesulfobacteriota bacterium]